MAYTNLTSLEIASARPVFWSSLNVNGWERYSVFSSKDSNASFNEVFKFYAVAGRNYAFTSNSFLDPDELRITDASGVIVQGNFEFDDGPRSTAGFNDGPVYSADFVRWSAPYSGTFYVDADWKQGTDLKGVRLEMLEDVDSQIGKGPALADIVRVFKSEKTGVGINPASNAYLYMTNEGEANVIASHPGWP